jgi:hypothetical protein
MKNNKLISALLVLLVCLSLVFSVSATSSANAESALTYTVEASSSTVKPGDSVTVTIGIAENTGFYYALVGLKYDPELFVIEHDDKGNVSSIVVEENTTDFGDISVGNKGTGLITIVVGGNPFAIFDNPDAPKYEKNGMLVKVTFTVKETADVDVISLFTLEAHKSNVLVNNMVEIENIGDLEKGYAKDVYVDWIRNCNLVSTNHDCSNYDPAIDAAVAPDCVNTGLTEGTHCPVCYKVFVEQKVVDALGHKYGDWTVTKEATTKAPGEEQRVCSVCGDIETREIAKRSVFTTPVVIALIVAVVALVALVAVFVIRKKKLLFWK